jgi:hypothetical protein
MTRATQSDWLFLLTLIGGNNRVTVVSGTNLIGSFKRWRRASILHVMNAMVKVAEKIKWLHANSSNLNH